MRRQLVAANEAKAHHGRKDKPMILRRLFEAYIRALSRACVVTVTDEDGTETHFVIRWI